MAANPALKAAAMRELSKTRPEDRFTARESRLAPPGSAGAMQRDASRRMGGKFGPYPGPGGSRTFVRR